MSKWLQCLACTSCCKMWDLHVLSAGKNLDGISHSQRLPAVTLAGWARKLAVLFQLPCWESQSQASPFWASDTLPNLTYPSQLVILASVSFLALTLRSSSLWPCEHIGTGAPPVWRAASMVSRYSCILIHSFLLPPRCSCDVTNRWLQPRWHVRITSPDGLKS